MMRLEHGLDHLVRQSSATFNLEVVSLRLSTEEVFLILRVGRIGLANRLKLVRVVEVDP